MKIDKIVASPVIKTEYVKLMGNLAVGALLSQIVYWDGPDKKGAATKMRVVRDGVLWIAKTREEWMEECCLTEWQFRAAVLKLKALGLIQHTVKHFYGYPTQHIRLIEDRLKELVEANQADESSTSLLMKPQEPSRGILKNHIEVSSSSYITESTTEITTEISTCLAVPDQAETGQEMNLEEIQKKIKEKKEASKKEPVGKRSVQMHWKAGLAESTGHFQQNLTGKDAGQLKMLAKDLGDVVFAVIDYTLENWWGFIKRVEYVKNTLGLPAEPDLNVLFTHRYAARNFYLQSIAKPTPAKVFQMPAPLAAKPISEEDAPYCPTYEDMAQTMAKFKG